MMTDSDDDSNDEDEDRIVFETGTDVRDAVMPSQLFVLRDASRHSLVPYGTFGCRSLLVHASKNVFTTSVNFVVSLPVYSSFTRSHSQVRSITVFDSPNPDSLVSVVL